MNDKTDFNDPAFIGRVQAWAAQRREDDRAPGRLVDAIMTQVVATPRRTIGLPRFGLRGLAGYAALTAVITIGVTLGILFAQSIDERVGQQPTSPVITQPPPSPTPFASVGPGGSPAPLATLSSVPLGVSAIEASNDGVWAVDRTNRLSELDPVSGSIIRSVDLPRPVIDLLVTADSVWAASAEGDLVRVDRGTLAIVQVAGAVGGALSEIDGTVWLGGVDEVRRIDAVDNIVALRVPVAGRDAQLGIAADAAGLWVSTRTQIVRLDGVSGAVVSQIPGDAAALVLADGVLWAVRGTELLRIDPASAEILAFIPLVSGGPMAVTGGRVWIAGPPGGGVGVVVGVDVATGAIAFRGSVPANADTLAVGGAAIWVGSAEEDAIVRFSLP